MNNLPIRNPISHEVYFTYDSQPIVFVTVCTKNKSKFSDLNESHQLLISLWSDDSHWKVGTYVIMPEHLHFLAQWSCGGTASLKKWISYWKSQFKKKYSDKNFHWQSGWFDHRIRNDGSYFEKLEYIKNNPKKRGLVSFNSEWIYQGVIHDI